MGWIGKKGFPLCCGGHERAELNAHWAQWKRDSGAIIRIQYVAARPGSGKGELANRVGGKHFGFSDLAAAEVWLARKVALLLGGRF
jgi:hypothetical protein